MRVYTDKYIRPKILLVLTNIPIFVLSFLLILGLYKLTTLENWLVDIKTLILFIIPVLIIILYFPLAKSLKKSKQAEETIINSNRIMKEKVMEQSRELHKLNCLLQTEYTEALRLSEEISKNVIESLGVGVSVIGPDMRILSTNSQMRKWHPQLGIFQNQRCYKVYVFEDADKVCKSCPVQAVFKEGKTTSGIVQRLIEGELRSCKIITSPVIDLKGNIVAVTQLVEDINEQKKYRNDLKLALNEKTKELGKADSRYRSLVLNSAEGIFVFDPLTNTIQEANTQFLSLLRVKF